MYFQKSDSQNYIYTPHRGDAVKLKYLPDTTYYLVFQVDNDIPPGNVGGISFLDKITFLWKSQYHRLVNRSLLIKFIEDAPDILSDSKFIPNQSHQSELANDILNFLENEQFVEGNIELYYELTKLCFDMAVKSNSPVLADAYMRYLSFLVEDAENYSEFFRRKGIQREAEIDNIAYEESSDDVRAFLIQNSEESRNILRYLVEKWFLRRYDIPNAFRLQKLLNQHERAEKASKKKQGSNRPASPSPSDGGDNQGQADNQQPPRTHMGRWVGVSLGIFFVILVALALPGIPFYKWVGLKVFAPLIKHWSTIPANPWSYPINVILAGIYLLAFFFFFCVDLWWRREAYHFRRLLVPRLLGGIVVGYLPLLVTSDLWKFAFKAEWYVIFLIMIGAVIACWIYLFVEVSNIVLDKRLAFNRASLLLVLGLVESLVIGLVASDLFAEKLLQNSVLVTSKLEIPTILGTVYVDAVSLYFPMALFIGIFIQILWEDKPITEPL